MAARFTSSSAASSRVGKYRNAGPVIGRIGPRHASPAPRGPHNTLVAELVHTMDPLPCLVVTLSASAGDMTKGFNASKLKVDFKEGEMNPYSGIMPRTYILSHCDFTANITLTISNIIGLHQLRGWYCKDDVVGEWKVVKNETCLHIHCFVSGPNSLIDLAAEFRYQIFSKEMPLVLRAVLHGDASLFRDHPGLMDSIVWVYFHSSMQKYNRMECWGPLKDAAQGRQRDQLGGHHLTGREEASPVSEKWTGPRSIFQALFAFLL